MGPLRTTQASWANITLVTRNRAKVGPSLDQIRPRLVKLKAIVARHGAKFDNHRPKPKPNRPNACPIWANFGIAPCWLNLGPSWCVSGRFLSKSRGFRRLRPTLGPNRTKLNRGFLKFSEVCALASVGQISPEVAKSWAGSAKAWPGRQRRQYVSDSGTHPAEIGQTSSEVGQFRAESAEACSKSGPSRSKSRKCCRALANSVNRIGPSFVDSTEFKRISGLPSRFEKGWTNNHAQPLPRNPISGGHEPIRDPNHRPPGPAKRSRSIKTSET